MGEIIPFPESKRVVPSCAQTLGPAIDPVEAITFAVGAGCGQAEVLTAARAVIERCRDTYGFVVMRDGLPADAAVLGRALLELFRGLMMLEPEMKVPRTYPTFGVYFGYRQLAWFEDGYSGTTGLALPNDIKAGELADFLRPRVAARRTLAHE